jgi:hypothetical protein
VKWLGVGALVGGAGPVAGRVLLAALPQLSGGVPGPRGIVAGQLVIVSSLLMCQSRLFLS